MLPISRYAVTVPLYRDKNLSIRSRLLFRCEYPILTHAFLNSQRTRYIKEPKSGQKTTHKCKLPKGQSGMLVCLSIQILATISAIPRTLRTQEKSNQISHILRKK